MNEEEKQKQEEILEYLSRMITGKKRVELQIVDVPCSYADVVSDEIFIQKEDGIAETDYEKKRFWKAYDLHESAHISWSGTLLEEYKGWKPKEDGEFMEFKDTVNVVEDIRIEAGLCEVLPQSRKYFKEFLDKFVEVRGKDGILNPQNNLNMALRFELEEKKELKYEIDKDAEPYVKEAAKKFHDLKVNEGNWDDAVNCSKEIHRIFEKARKKFPDKFASEVAKKGMEMEGIAIEMDGVQAEFGELKVRDAKLSSDIKEKTKEGKDLVEAKKSGSIPDKELAKKTKELAEAAEKLLKEKEKIKKGLEKNADKHKELKEKYDKAKAELDKLRRKAEGRPHIGDGFVRIISFEKRKEKGDLSDKKTGEIAIEMSMREVELDDDAEPSGATFEYEYDELSRFKELPVPKVEPFYPEDTKFNSEGSYKIPEIEIAMETGDEIASSLKRELQLKKDLVRKKTSGKIDMKRVRKQFRIYGGIKEADIFARSRKLLPEHSVLVIIDMSGSMAGHKLTTAKQAFATLARTLSILRVPFSLRGYSARDSKSVIADIVMKEFDREECIYEDIDKAYFPIGLSGWWGQNRDGDSWRHAAGLLNQQKGDKLLVVICDGQPHHGGTPYIGYTAYEDSKLAIEQIEGMGIKTIGISIDPAANKYIEETFNNSFFFDGDKLNDFSTGLTEVYLKAMKF